MVIRDHVIDPVIRWVGGKRKLLERIVPLFPPFGGTYYEPFVGGGAIMLTQLDHVVKVNDINSELINFYRTIHVDLDTVIETFNTFKNDASSYYEIRSWDRDLDYHEKRSPYERAARFLYINKASFQGLWRVNSKKGYHNVPYSRPKNVSIDRDDLLKFAIATNDISFNCLDYEEFLHEASSDDFIYLDPPYVPISQTSSFTGYTKDGFDHARLKNCCEKLDARGAKFLMSNSDCEITRNLYASFKQETLSVSRNMAAKTSSRGVITELLIRNYDR